MGSLVRDHDGCGGRDGITPRRADVTGDIQVADLQPAWLYLVLAAGAANAARLVEGRKRGPAARDGKGAVRLLAKGG